MSVPMSEAVNRPMTGAFDIVMIDDDELTLESASRRLRKSEIALLPLSDGETLVEVLTAHSIRVLIVDYHLARGTGLDLIRSLKLKKVTLPDTMILATASRPAPDVLSSAQALGMSVMLKDALINTATLESLAGPAGE